MSVTFGTSIKSASLRLGSDFNGQLSVAVAISGSKVKMRVMESRKTMRLGENLILDGDIYLGELMYSGGLIKICHLLSTL